MEHHFNTNIAKEYGIEEAILIHHFYFWIAKNAANEKHFYDGLYWTYNSRDAYARFFGYINDAKIYRVIKKLIEKGLLIKGDYNTDKWKHTNWYALTIKGLEYLNNHDYDMTAFESILQNANNDCCKMNNGLQQNEQSIIISSTNSNTNTKEEDTNVSPKKNDYKAIVDCWNEYNGDKLGKVVKLTERRKKAIKRMMEDNGIDQEQLMKLFKSLPYADKWLYNPNKQHQNWKPDFDWWMANTNGWLTKALEGKVHNENPQAFASIVRGDELGEMPYTPQTDGNIHWNDYYKCYIFIGMFRGEVTDGYTDDNRPNGATLMLNNGAGTIKWNKEGKSWIKL